MSEQSDAAAASQQGFAAALSRVLAALVRHAERRGNSSTAAPAPVASAAEPAAAEPDPLARLRRGFGLSPFECDVLLLCAGVELDGRFAEACAAAHGDARRELPTFALALAALPQAHYSALLPSAPLRRLGLIELRGLEHSETLLACPLRIAERVLHHLVGLTYLDESLALLSEVSAPPLPLPPRYRVLSEQAVAPAAGTEQSASVCLLYGPDRWGQQAVAGAAAAALGRRLFAVSAAALPRPVDEQAGFVRAWAREAVLGHAALFIDCHDVARPELTALRGLLERLAAPLFLGCREPSAPCDRPIRALAVERLAPAEQLQLWQVALGEPEGTSELGALAAHFQLDIRTLGELAVAQRSVGTATLTRGAALWEACRAASRTELCDLGQRRIPAASWGDLVLPEEQQATLREIAAQVRARDRVLQDWGFGSASRGQGITALFVGQSGTGKTLAAEVLANELSLDLYHIDLSQVVSKYIGETEKNLRRVFDTAEASGAILLFDEADALFGKRSEVKDSHDRYANIEVSYLLQRMESYRGLAILTTNHKGSLDAAFLRRLGFVVNFPFPDSTQRSAIWQRAFPKQTPTLGLDYDKLARLQLGGGNIAGIALRSAYLAAFEGVPVSMRHLLRATRSELAKLERPLSAGDVGDWS